MEAGILSDVIEVLVLIYRMIEPMLMPILIMIIPFVIFFIIERSKILYKMHKYIRNILFGVLLLITAIYLKGDIHLLNYSIFALYAFIFA